jgi:hypothetical protein
MEAIFDKFGAGDFDSSSEGTFHLFLVDPTVDFDGKVLIGALYYHAASLRLCRSSVKENHGKIVAWPIR